MNSLSLRIVRLFVEIGKERLDLHALFEAVGNVPTGRRLVLDSIEELVSADMLNACGGDFYELTEGGRRAIPQL